MNKICNKCGVELTIHNTSLHVDAYMSSMSFFAFVVSSHFLCFGLSLRKIKKKSNMGNHPF